VKALGEEEAAQRKTSEAGFGSPSRNPELLTDLQTTTRNTKSNLGSAALDAKRGIGVRRQPAASPQMGCQILQYRRSTNLSTVCGSVLRAGAEAF
jgi:hypothetical protein